VLQYGEDGVQSGEQVHSIHSFDPWQVRDHWVEITFPLEKRTTGTRYDISILNPWVLIDEVIISGGVAKTLLPAEH
jgi:hypothetical protein